MLIKRFIAGILIFFTPSIVSIIFELINVDVENIIYACDNIERTSMLESYFNTSYEVDASGSSIPNTGTYGSSSDNSKDNISGDSNKEQSSTIIIPKTITVATWNVGYGKKLNNLKDADFANKIKSESINILGLQEIKTRGNDYRILSGNIAALSGLNSVFCTETKNAEAIISNLKYVSTNSYFISKCGYQTAAQKAIINVDGVDVSFYNVHFSYKDGCAKKQTIDLNKKLRSDPNPIILVGDFNVARSCDIIVDNLDAGYEIISYDTITPGIKCTDSIIINSKNHLKLVKGYSVKTKDILTDHNMILAKLKVY